MQDDARLIRASMPAGEIGQVGQATYLHGFTAAVGILRAQPSEAQG